MALQVTDQRTTDLVPYERGISLREIVEGTLGRFLPGSVIGMGGLAAVVNIIGPGGPLSFLAEVGFMLSSFAGPLAMGFGLGLVGLSRWLYPDSKVSGRRSFIAGLLSPLAFSATTLLIGGPFQGFTLVGFLVGVAMAFGMYFAWLSPTPEEMRDDRYEPDQPGQLPDGSPNAT